MQGDETIRGGKHGRRHIDGRAKSNVIATMKTLTVRREPACS